MPCSTPSRIWQSVSFTFAVPVRCTALYVGRSNRVAVTVAVAESETSKPFAPASVIAQSVAINSALSCATNPLARASRTRQSVSSLRADPVACTPGPPAFSIRTSLSVAVEPSSSSTPAIPVCRIVPSVDTSLLVPRNRKP